MLVFSVFTFLFFKFLIVEMKSKLSAAPITTQFRLKVVCVQCSDEISTVSLFFCLSLSVFLGVLFVCDTDLTGCEITLHSLFVWLYACLFDCFFCFFLFFVCFLFVCLCLLEVVNCVWWVQCVANENIRRHYYVLLF